MEKKRPTIADVARLARVSEATVSGILNNSPLQAPETASRVHMAMQELGYTPRRNKLRQENRRHQKIETIALLAPDRNVAALGTELFAQLAAGAERELFDNGYHLLPCHLDADGNLPELFLSKRLIKGVIIRSGWSGVSQEMIRRNEKILSRFVIVSTFSPDLSVGDSVGVDNVSCAQWVVDQISPNPPERILCLHPSGSSLNADLFIRSSMFSFLLNKIGLNCETSIFSPDDSKEIPGWNAHIPCSIFVTGHDHEVRKVATLLKECPGHRTTLYAVMTSDLPKELQADFIHTIHIDPYRIGMAAAELLCRRIPHPYDISRRLLIPPRELQIRQEQTES